MKKLMALLFLILCSPAFAGTLTATRVPVASGAAVIVDSVIYNEGYNVGIGSTHPQQVLDVLGTVKATQFSGGGAGITGVSSNPTLMFGTLTRDTTASSGDVSYTGVGFTPRYVVFLAGKDGAANQGFSVGFDDGTNHYGMNTVNSGTCNVWSPKSIVVITGNGAYQQAFIKTIDADGFTLTWAKTGSPSGTGTVYYLAVK